MKLKRLPTVKRSNHPDEKVRGFVNGLLSIIQQMRISILDKRCRDYRIRNGK